MRVLHVDTGREMRGGQWQVLYLLRAAGGTLMARRGSPLFDSARSEGVEVLALGVPALARGSRRHDLVHAHDARAHTFAAALCVRPLVVSRRVAFAVRRGRLSRLKYSRASHYIAVSGFVRERLLEAGVPADRITVVHDGVPPSGVVSDRSGPVVAPAFDDPRKGSDLASRAAALAGVGLRFESDLRAAFSRASLFLYLTREEGFGSAALLAMAAGVPVVASRTGGLPEAVGDAGILVGNDPAEIAGAVRRVLEDGSLAARLAALGRERALSRFSISDTAASTAAVYRKVLG